MMSDRTNDVAEVYNEKGLTFDRHFSDPDVSPYDQVEWDTRAAVIKDEKGNVIFEQEGVEVPAFYSQLATNILASKYFYGERNTSEREYSVRQTVGRVADTIAEWGLRRHFRDAAAAQVFRDELTFLLLNQYAAFNSPVWFNVGLYQKYGVLSDATNWRWDGETGRAVPLGPGEGYRYPQSSACFIQGVDDNMASIMDLAKSEAMLFKYGSGTGTDLSTLRSSREKLSGGGTPSGPMSFFKVYDTVASVIKSGGVTRRAARMQTLKVWHPDVMDFIDCKMKEEKKAQALIAAGYEANFNGEAYSSVQYQNTNISVRATDDFMRAALAGDNWVTTAVTTGQPVDTLLAAEVLDRIAENTHACGDPGMQYEDTIQKWHTCPNTAPINSSNPCCFVYGTLVRTSEGPIPIGKLAEMASAGESLPLAHAFDRESGAPVLRQIKGAWCAGETRRLVDVTTRRGLKFRSTPEHNYLTYSGDYVEAQSLKPGDHIRGDIVHSVEVVYGVTEGTFVYDIEVEDAHNFEITCDGFGHGVIARNSEYMFIDDSACNLSSINLMKFRLADGTFDAAGYEVANRIMITAQEILVDNSSYPNEKIAANSHKFRPLGLGYANLGCLLMANGVPYDSDEGRALAAGITAMMQGAAYSQSARTAYSVGAFDGFAANKEPMTNVVRMHYDAVKEIHPACPPDIREHASALLADAYIKGCNHGYRNSQVSVLAPTGTIAFLMDCDTTGLEPDIALVKYKSLAGRGTLKIVNQTVGLALQTIGYADGSDGGRDEVGDILAYVEAQDTIVGAPHLKGEHLPVFDCAFPAANDPSQRSIHYTGHIRMMAAVQPFLSGAVSKTVNVPSDATVADIRDTYVEAWKLGVKALAVYRDGSKGSQPLSTKKASGGDAKDGLFDEAERKRRFAAVDRLFAVAADLAGWDKLEGGRVLTTEALERLADEAEAAGAPAPYVCGNDGGPCPGPAACDPCVRYPDGLPVPAAGYRQLQGEVERLRDQLDATPAAGGYQRRRLPDTRQSVTHKFDIQGHEGYVNVGFFEDGTPGEMFITMSKEGSTVGGLMDIVGTLTSIALQSGVPVETLVNKFAHTRFEPAGFTKNPDVPIAKSVVDYVFRWLGMEFVPGYWEANSPQAKDADGAAPRPPSHRFLARPFPARDLGLLQAGRKSTAEPAAEFKVPAEALQKNGQVSQFKGFQSDAPACPNCGAITVRNGSCYRCFGCGESLGCS
jgi:ribonucleotide reductase alpha subunit